MTRPIRLLAAKLFVTAATFVPFALPALAAAPPAEDRRGLAAEVPEARRKSAKELHAALLKSSGWVRFEVAPGSASHGTAWVVDAGRRLMVTNDHVVAGTDEVRVLFPKYADGKLIREEAAYRAEKGVRGVVIDRDRVRDLAVVQLDSLPEGTTALALAAEEPDEGDPVRTIGGFTNGGDGLVWGGVGGEVRSVGENGGLNNAGRVRTVLSTVPNNGGNSGGPLVNAAGEVVGVNSYGVLKGAGGRAVNGVAGHVSVNELRGYLALVEPLIEPKTAARFTARGERKLDAGRADAAARDFAQAIGADPAFAPAYYLRGKAFTFKNDFRTAVEDLNEAIRLDGTKYDYRVARGTALRLAGRTDEAMADFGAAIRSDPTRGAAYNQRGLAHGAAKNPGEAAADFARAVAADGENPQFRANRAEALMDLKKFDEAAADWRAAAKLAPWQPNYVIGLGNALLAAGRPAEAARTFLAGAEQSGHPMFLSKAGLALRAAGDHRAAVKLFTDALKGFGDNGPPAQVATAHVGRGLCLTALKQYKDAVDDFTRAIDLTGGKDGGLYALRAEAYRLGGAENLAADDLATAEKLGHKVAKGPAQERKEARAADPIPGTWKMATFVNGVQLSQVITFRTNGTFEGTTRVASQLGAETIADTGTWEYEKGKLTIRGKKTGTVVRKVAPSGDAMDVEVTEIGKTVTFSREK